MVVGRLVAGTIYREPPWPAGLACFLHPSCHQERYQPEKDRARGSCTPTVAGGVYDGGTVLPIVSGEETAVSNVLLVVAFILGVLLTVFGVQNTEGVRVNFLGFSTGSAPLALVILASALVGAALTFLIGLRGRIRTSLELRRRDRRVRELEAELRARPAGSTAPAQTTVDYSAADSTTQPPSQ